MQDVDCLDTSLCCFDGCVNVCQGRGARPEIQKPDGLKIKVCHCEKMHVNELAH